MSWWLPHKFEEKRPYLAARADIMRAVRGFFESRDFLAVETPVLQVCPTMDTHIHGFKTALKDANLNCVRDLYLQTSPEFDMKKLMVAGLKSIYQICPVFRNGEGSKLHSPEFTMLEWYRTGAGYTDIMADCEALLTHIAKTLGIQAYRHKDRSANPFAKWQKISVSEAFDHYAGIDLAQYLEDTSAFAAAIAETGIRTAEGDSWDDLFFRVMAENIEPYLGQGAPAILYDYPLCMASLARRKADDPRFAERFELYVCGVELANGFGELTDAAEQEKRFNAEMDEKEKLYGERYPVDKEFIKALEHGLPESSGIALGLDRLVMLACGVDDIEKVLWAPVMTAADDD